MELCFVVLGDVIIYINIIIIANENEFFHPLMYLNINHHYYSKSKDIWVGGEDKLQNNQFEVLAWYDAWSIDMFIDQSIVAPIWDEIDGIDAQI